MWRITVNLCIHNMSMLSCPSPQFLTWLSCIIICKQFQKKGLFNSQFWRFRSKAGVPIGLAFVRVVDGNGRVYMEEISHGQPRSRAVKKTLYMSLWPRNKCILYLFNLLHLRLVNDWKVAFLLVLFCQYGVLTNYF